MHHHTRRDYYGWDEPPLAALAWRAIAQAHLGGLHAGRVVATIREITAQLKLVSGRQELPPSVGRCAR